MICLKSIFWKQKIYYEISVVRDSNLRYQELTVLIEYEHILSSLSLLHSERPKLFTILAFLSSKG